MPAKEILAALKDSSGILSIYQLKNGRNTIGRGKDRDLSVDVDESSEVSREHFSLNIDDGSGVGLTVIDERDKPINLTYINGYSIETGKVIEVRLNDTISMGTKGYRLHLTEPDMTMARPFEEIRVENDDVFINGRSMNLIAGQVSAIKLLIDHPGETLSYGYIYSHVSKGSANNRVNAKYYCQRLIGTIRKEINERYSGFLIKTMDGEGYQYRRPELEWASLT